MIKPSERRIILKCAKKYRVSSVFLFGSSAEKNKKYNDIDIGIKGIKPKLFFKFYAELIKNLPKNVDLVDMSKKSKFIELVEKGGERIYG